MLQRRETSMREIPVMDIEAAIAYVERKHVAEGCCREGRPAPEEVDASGKEERHLQKKNRSGYVVSDSERAIETLQRFTSEGRLTQDIKRHISQGVRRGVAIKVRMRRLKKKVEEVWRKIGWLDWVAWSGGTRQWESSRRCSRMACRSVAAEGCCREGRPAPEEVDASGKEERVRVGVRVREAHKTIVRKDFRLRVERA
ncbi:hypothetical protein QE152_g17093 [Popillia japonica]|uniref:Uncharacterized protein n=1 Tax=Popillia japonica TaxID=7064 RepID=A0AAW1L1V7_POPJA